MKERLLALADRADAWVAAALPQRGIPAWAWPLAELGIGAGATLAAVVVVPGAHETLTLFGQPFGEPCGFLTLTGKPCPSCGMTRSWVWGVRGAWFEAVRYSPAGATLLLWLQLTGLQGLARLVSRRYTLARLDYRWLAAWVLVWMLFLNTGHWVARLAGFNPLPVP
ncbi:MAG: DUF2752 domain-containing protein [Deltaproteobacteria bacterium]|nr:DUF2752 domain-containing protein [Deltaproteobacteria bacterium]